MKPPGSRLFLSQDEIKSIVGKMAAAISADYARLLSPEEKLCAVVILKGALFFAADLLREITVPLEMELVWLASYGVNKESSGIIRQIHGLSCDLENRHVLILDEIADTRRTLSYLEGQVREAKPKSVRVAAFLDKPARKEIDLSLDYVGATVENQFLIGYGLDHGEKYRTLKEIYFLEDGSDEEC